MWVAFLLQTYVNLKQYDNSLYANVEDLTADWMFYLETSRPPPSPCACKLLRIL